MFLPAMEVQTKSGKLLVPGQVIRTDSGLKFVPGEIVATERGGALFVPGLVLDSPDGAKFLRGEVVETADGPRLLPPGKSSFHRHHIISSYQSHTETIVCISDLETYLTYLVIQRVSPQSSAYIA